MVQVNSKYVYTVEQHSAIIKNVQKFSRVTVRVKCELTGEYESYHLGNLCCFDKLANDLDVAENLLHDNAKPDNKRLYVRTSEETLISSPGDNILFKKKRYYCFLTFDR